MNGEAGGFICGLILGAFVAMMLTAAACHGNWQEDVIKRGHAKYNETTGKFEWRDGNCLVNLKVEKEK